MSEGPGACEHGEAAPRDGARISAGRSGPETRHQSQQSGDWRRSAKVIVVMRRDATEREIEDVLKHLQDLGLSGHLSRGVERTVIGVVGQVYPESEEHTSELQSRL